MEVTVGEAAATAGGEGDDVLPEPALEVVVRSPEIQDAEPIRSAPMTEAATSSRGGIELLADELVDPATVARHLEAVCQAEQWIVTLLTQKVHLAPNTQQAEQAGFARTKSNDDVPVNFS
jgi:hypothetical protein